MSAEIPTPSVDKPPPRSLAVRSNRRQLLLFAALTPGASSVLLAILVPLFFFSILVSSPVHSAARPRIALRKATIPVTDQLSNIRVAPDLIHGQHHLEPSDHQHRRRARKQFLYLRKS